MTDLEITRLCAEAMGLTWESGFGEVRVEQGGTVRFANSNRSFRTSSYNPLHDDAQAMALVKKFAPHIESYGVKPMYASDVKDGVPSVTHWSVIVTDDASAEDSDLNRAICECVAKMQKAKK